jgi:hypothetical protein
MQMVCAAKPDTSCAVAGSQHRWLGSAFDVACTCQDGLTSVVTAGALSACCDPTDLMNCGGNANGGGGDPASSNSTTPPEPAVVCSAPFSQAVAFSPSMPCACIPPFTPTFNYSAEPPALLECAPPPPCVSNASLVFSRNADGTQWASCHCSAGFAETWNTTASGTWGLVGCTPPPPCPPGSERDAASGACACTPGLVSTFNTASGYTLASCAPPSCPPNSVMQTYPSSPGQSSSPAFSCSCDANMTQVSVSPPPYTYTSAPSSYMACVPPPAPCGVAGAQHAYSHDLQAASSAPTSPRE